MTRAKSYAEIQPVEPEWRFPGWVQQGGVTYIAGDGGVGKSFLTADWAARITRGLPLPGTDGESTEPGSVILISAEDDPNMSMAYRLRAANADLSRVYDMTDDFTVPDGLASLRDDIAEIGDVKMVVIDPLAAVLGTVPGTRRQLALTSGNATLRRAMSMPLERFARSTGVAVVVIHHTVKSGRTAGSKAITDAARQVLRITRSSQDERIRVITVDKTNVVSDSGATLAYTLTGSGMDTHVEYLAVPDELGEAPREPTTEEKILSVLADAAKAGQGEVQTQKIAAHVGVDYTAVRVALTRAKHRGKVHSPKRGYWALGPSQETVTAPDLELVAP